jgi:hypothetical protein
MSLSTLTASQPSTTSTPIRFQLECAWPAPAEAVRDDVVRFWATEGALPDPSVAQPRAQQLLVVARDASGNVVGVSTAERGAVPQLGFDCFYYRTFVGRSARARGLRSTELVWDILRESYGLLNERFTQGIDCDVPGIYAEMENPSIMRNCRDAVWRDMGMNFVFIGRTPEGWHQRVWYFDGAKIP